MHSQFVTTAVAAAFVLGVVVLVHEFGHFIVAKWARVYVKTFSIGFGKKVLRRRRGETEYTVSILPFGGYVKFAGESDLYEEDEEEERKTAEEIGPKDEIPDYLIPRERYFTTKPPLVRAAVLFAGPFMNYALAVLIYVGIFLFHGVEVAPTSRIGAIAPGGPADSVGLMVGDEIVAIDAQAVRGWGDVENAFASDVAAVKEFRVLRDGVEVDIPFRALVESNAVRIGFSPWFPPRLGRVPRGKPAYEAGMRAGAMVEAINDTAVTSYDDIRRIVNANAGVPLYIRWTLDGVSYADSVVPEPTEVLKVGTVDEFEVVGVIGIGPSYERQRKSLAASLSSGFREANHKIAQIVWYLKQLILRKMGVKSLGGPILIAQMAGDVANWGFDYLLLFLAFFNINLCIFNLLPILPFDGGHLSIIAVEGIARRPLNRRLRGWLTQGGFILVILLMAFVVLLDLSRCTSAGPGPF